MDAPKDCGMSRSQRGWMLAIGFIAGMIVMNLICLAAAAGAVS